MHATPEVTGLPIVVDRVGPFAVEHPRVASIALGRGETWLRSDAVVGSRGEVEQVEGGGVDLRLQQAFLGHGARFDHLRGSGEVLVAAGDDGVHLVRVHGTPLTANATHLLGFSGALTCTLGTVRPAAMTGQDLATAMLAGTGTVVLTGHGPPVAVPVDGHLRVSPSAVAWWAGDLTATATGTALPRDGITFWGRGQVVLQPVGSRSHSV